MQIGKAVTLRDLNHLDAFPFDYYEVSVCSLLEGEKAQTAEFCRQLKSSGKPVFSACGLFPWRYLFYEFDNKLFEDWLRPAFDLLADLGAKKVVFGSGGARRYDPAKMSYAKAVARVGELLRLTEKYADAANIQIGWEPLNRWETNVGNSLVESAWILRDAGLGPRHGITADLFHMNAVGDEPSDIARAACVVHAHFAAPKSRDFIRESDAFDYRPFFDAVRAAGLDHATMEGGFGTPEPACIEFMHRISTP